MTGEGELPDERRLFIGRGGKKNSSTRKKCLFLSESRRSAAGSSSFEEKINTSSVWRDKSSDRGKGGALDRRGAWLQDCNAELLEFNIEIGVFRRDYHKYMFNFLSIKQ